MLASKEYADWSKKLDDERQEFRAKQQAKKEYEYERLKRDQKDILNGNWEKYVPFGDIIDFFHMYLFHNDVLKDFLSVKFNVITIINKYDMDGNIIENCSDNLKSDKDVVYAAVKQNPFAIIYAANEFKYDKELAMSAVKQNGLALECFNNFQNDEDVVFSACNQNGEAYQFGSDELKLNKHIAIIALESNNIKNEYYIFEHLIDRFKNDKDCILTALKHDERDVYWSISDELKKDPNIHNAILMYTNEYK